MNQYGQPLSLYPPGHGLGGGAQQPQYDQGAPTPTQLSNMANKPNLSNPNPGGAPADPNAAVMGGPGAPLPLLSEIDTSIQCNKSFLRCTIGKIVNSQSVANASRLPLGAVIQPMCGDVGDRNSEIDVIDFGSTGIVRCKRCRSYINPYVAWMDNGRRWRCNICGLMNDVPTSYFSHLDSNGFRRDRDQRPELSRCSVEFIAPGDYMVRPPQPPAYFFVMDVSAQAVQAGVVASAVLAIKASLDDMPGNPRTLIGFITYDSSIHFYNLKSSLKAPQMLVVSDINDPLTPLPEDLLVNLQESRAVVDALLDSLPSMFTNSTNSNACLGPALMACKRVLEHIGGKVSLFQSSLPTLGEGSLKPRENPRLLGTDKEHTLLQTSEESNWYKANGIDFSRIQIAIDVYLFSAAYTDLATISVLSKYSSGNCYYYPAFQSSRDGVKFQHDLEHALTRTTAFEAVMRVRATRGVRIGNFYGNFFIRGTDLLSLPNCTSDSTFGFDLAYDETVLTAQAVTVQAALLYTSSNGERRIRVHNMLIPVTNSLAEMVDSLDIDTAMNVLSKQAIDIASKSGFENARQRVQQTAVDMLRGTRTVGGVPGQGDAIPPTLRLLPLYAMALQKCMILRGGVEIRADERAYYHQLVSNMGVSDTRVFIYPRLFSIHDMTSDIGLPCDSDTSEPQYADVTLTAGPLRVRLPGLLNLTHERLSSDGLFLLENGVEMLMWIGRNVNPAILHTLFNLSTLEGVDTRSLEIQSENSDYSSRVNSVVVALRQEKNRYMQLHFVKEGDGYAEAYFARFLVEDRANFAGAALSYTEYYGLVMKAMMGM